MRRKPFRPAGALTLAAGLVGWSAFVGPRLSPRWQVPIHTLLAAALVRLTRAPLGLRQPELGRGLRLGLAVAAAVSAGVATTTAVPRVRGGMLARELPDPAAWLLVRIPVGTVWSEEAAFRAALGTMAADAFGPRAGRVVQSAAFGLSHVADARRTGEPVLGTVLVTGAAGWALDWLYARSGSLAASMLAHLAINEAGAVAALAVQGRFTRRARPS
ncbi:CPBP family intramembrane glutamic endopeptidase [Mycobacterium sp. URHB0044]|jgi:membrane protease YdiL (CAAX protease family)|uniref:Rv0804 family intramembrane glutamic endopeptidase n=1 Tax=Mycobacterium sp. URHB0044 TaxID=1380386 RepID=UPI00048A7C3D|nr:CPBP family intramembrane glutamic endopeptidase [Mycobacterium sp. URHB0044]